MTSGIMAFIRSEVSLRLRYPKRDAFTYLMGSVQADAVNFRPGGRICAIKPLRITIPKVQIDLS